MTDKDPFRLPLLTHTLVIWFLCYKLTLTNTVTLNLSEFPFRNTSLPYSTRIDDLVSRLSLDELVQQMSRGGGGGDGGPVPAISRLDIGSYWWGTECNHGNIFGKATAFPQSLGFAATFNPELIWRVADAISTEVRARNNDFVKRKIFTTHTGLNCFSPTINIMRHPLWGRNQETYGEDPYLSSVITASFVRGLQGDHPKYYRANSVCKHFDAYGGPEDLPQSRLSFNAQVPERDLWTTYLPQFKACVDAGALGVMCSYNSVDGIPACVNKKLLTGVLRDTWNFTGFVISDSGALEFILLNHHYMDNIQDTAVACANAGVNLELHAGGYARGVFDWLKNAVNEGQISQKVLAERVKPLFYTRMKLGEFDPPEGNPYLKLNLSVIQSPSHRELCTLTAMQSFVLLKNDGLLPLKTRFKSVAIVGPFANNPGQQIGNYAPELDLNYTTTPSSELSALGDKSTVVAGCEEPHCVDYDSTNVIAAVKNSDITFVCLGTGPAVENENFDRENMRLPGYQEKMLQDVINNAKGKIVLLLFSAGPLDIRMAENFKVSAILHCFFPAQATGIALYNVITMKTNNSNPAGRLPFTWYSSDAQVPSMTDYAMINHTYRYFGGDPLYPFGYGLSYSLFKYRNLVLTPTRVKAGNNVTATFTITNEGPYGGIEVYQVYISWLNATVATPKYELVGFGSTFLNIGESKTLNVTITGDEMAVWLPGRGFLIEPGEIVVYVGGQLPNQKTKLSSNVLKAIFTIYL